ncbi:MAG: hypothetical protein VX587_02850 [Thermoproteota archaeon]|nr:hypothetical protein [Thermoproteota archaeon]
MSENSPVKDALYAKIDALGQDKINALLLKKEFPELFKEVFEKAINKIDHNMDEDEKYGTMAESITHYLFTEMLIPSQRKISYDNVELDMIIPNTLELKKNTKNAIIVFFVKTNNLEKIQEKMSELKRIQEKDDNIWVISKDSLNLQQRSYVTNSISFGKFLQDAQSFIQSKKMNKLNIFKTKT